jgi:hypothetical protein
MPQPTTPTLAPCLMKHSYNFPLLHFNVLVFYVSEHLWFSLKTQTFAYYLHNHIPIIGLNWHIREIWGPVVLRTRSVSAYPETRLKDRIYVISVFLVSHLLSPVFTSVPKHRSHHNWFRKSVFFYITISLLSSSELWRKSVVTSQGTKKFLGENM